MQQVMTQPRVTRAENGKWQVIDRTGSVFAECDSNAAAWRKMDRLTNDAINRSEDVHDWSATQNMKA